MEFDGREQRAWYLKISKKPDHYFAEVFPINEGRGPLPLHGYNTRVKNQEALEELVEATRPNGYHQDPERFPLLPLRLVSFGGSESRLMITSALANLKEKGQTAFVVVTPDEREMQRRLEEWEVKVTGDESVRGKLSRPGLAVPAGYEPLPFGYPTFWDSARAAFSRFFSILPRLYESANSLAEAASWSGDQFQEAIAQLERLTMMAMSELIIMVGNGHGIGALRITRSMLEYGINAKYLLKEADAREQFLNWHFVEQHKLLNYMRRWGLDKNVDSERIKTSEEGYELVKHLFVKNDRGDLRGYWSDLDLGSRARAVGLEQIYEAVNPRATRIVHGTIGGLADQFSPMEEGKIRFITPPSLENCEMALHYGHLSELLVLEVLAEISGATPSPPLEVLSDDFDQAWGEK
jgi:hypothetical protein